VGDTAGTRRAGVPDVWYYGIVACLCLLAIWGGIDYVVQRNTAAAVALSHAKASGVTAPEALSVKPQLGGYLLPPSFAFRVQMEGAASSGKRERFEVYVLFQQEWGGQLESVSSGGPGEQ
jgi:hypothetical protein